MEQKRSFFEKITGTRDAGEGHELIPSSPSYPQTVPTEEKIKEVQKTFYAEIPTEQPVLKEKPFEFSKPQSPKQKEWLAETEGELVLDVYQTEKEIVIKSTLAGVRPEDIDITITNDMLSIKGVREKDEPVRQEDYYYQECYWGAFSRSVILPVEVEADQIQANLKNGILTVKLPKSEKVKTKKIAVSLG